ncbi:MULTISPECIES: flavodoxin domain-containing protein [unclassified Streptomyces]|uniref:flavodoxin domain-containing protein n=1 Tax=unclassified Streptomyces TaxID=2593676 RepID=UPI0022B600C6|nr:MULTISPECIES: flavodoxin domain-containing protein [unclassified Streptomyces]MCZ7414610.1 flavodoxin [Streptomyces sp. WMMC897]MCZ7431538.1 flavodoxin [Streptomyces sp. WMMC1477]
MADEPDQPGAAGRERRSDGPTVLVGYASAHGSTRSIAERVAAGLREAPAEADLRPLGEVADVHTYDAFVIGSAVHDMAWLPEALAFTRRHRPALRTRPLWIFSVGAPAALRGWGKAMVGQEEQKVVGELLDALRPRGHRLFSGVIRPEHLSVSGRIALKAMGLRYGDYRDWADVEDWTRQIAHDLVGGRPGGGD